MRAKHSASPGSSLISQLPALKIKNSIYHIIQALQEVNPAPRSASHIRQSVIAEWLKTQDVRKVQYLAGHRRIIATERYLAHHLEDLQESLKLHHPLGQIYSGRKSLALVEQS